MTLLQFGRSSWVASAKIVLPLLLSPIGILSPRPSSAQWVESAGAGWASVALYHQDTRRAFGVEGDRRNFPGGGHAVATSSYFTLVAGLGQSVDVWAQVPLLRLHYSDITGSRTSAGVGDARIYVRLAPLGWLGRQVPVAIRTGVKLPVGDFDVGSRLIPLGDGQRDWEVMLELGRSFYPRPVYTMGWFGYRWREARIKGRVEFGDEWLFYSAAGGDLGRVSWKLALDGWYGATPIFNAVPARGGEREMLRLNPSLLLSVGPGQAELGARVPLEGRNLPAGTDWVFGYFARFGF